jgi:hypothetical protein
MMVHWSLQTGLGRGILLATLFVACGRALPSQTSNAAQEAKFCAAIPSLIEAYLDNSAKFRSEQQCHDHSRKSQVEKPQVVKRQKDFDGSCAQERPCSNGTYEYEGLAHMYNWAVTDPHNLRRLLFERGLVWLWTRLLRNKWGVS